MAMDPNTVSALPPSLARDYEAKSEFYYSGERPEMLELIDLSHRRILDVGCSRGAFGAALKRRRSCEVWGVEPHLESSREAEKRLDKVVHGLFERTLPLPVAHFDCIVFNDVLEHMLAPEEALRAAHALLRPGGVVVASIPNIRHFPTLWHLLVHGSWEYEDCGTLDRTHLRFFTRKSVEQLFTNEGYNVEQIIGLNAYEGHTHLSRKAWAVYHLLNTATLGRVRDMKFLQFGVVARIGS